MLVHIINKTGDYMKLKLGSLIAVLLVVTAFLMNKNSIKIPEGTKNKGVFISYIEYKKYLKDKNELDMKKEIDKMINTVKDYNINFIILHVKPFSDAIYESKIFPSSSSIVSEEGDKLPFDVLDYFIKKAHKNNIQIHAWINPYRISNYTDTSKISITNPAYKWLNTNNVKVIQDKGIYYNPASSEVQELIISGVAELVENYDIDGIHMDDYFYPDDTIDLENYEQFKNTISLSDYRLSNTNKLVKSIYTTIKKIKPNVVFGISPEGNIENNYKNNYADVKTWITNEGYIDYIMPQLYYGFSNETQPFIPVINKWKDLITIDIDFMPALALYKVGIVDEYAKSGKEEWINDKDVITKQIKIINNMEKAAGYSLFRYSYLIEKNNDNLINQQLKLKEI